MTLSPSTFYANHKNFNAKRIIKQLPADTCNNSENIYAQGFVLHFSLYYNRILMQNFSTTLGFIKNDAYIWRLFKKLIINSKE